MGVISSFTERFVLPFDIKTSNFTFDVNRGVFADSAGTIEGLLPPTSAVGDHIEIIGTQGLWKITQGAGQQIYVPGANTTLGVSTATTGFIRSSSTADSIILVCRVADTIWWALGSPSGILTVV